MQYRYDKEKIQFPCLPLAVCVLQKKMVNQSGKSRSEILEAIKLGVNYFDTAYIYSGSEEAIGKIFEKKSLPGADLHCR